MDFGLKDKSIIVTGAANGIGASIYASLLVEGANPIGIDIKEFKASELEETLKKLEFEKKFQFHQADVSDEEAIQKILSNFDLIYGLVNNAGMLGGDQSHGGRTVSAWDKMMNNNAKSAYILTEVTTPKMTQRGSIVNIGSLELDMAAPEVVLYTASKGALWGLTVAYSTTLADKNIRVNMVSPGNVNTPRNMRQYSEHPDIIQGFENRTPLKRSVEPDEVANAVLFLLSNKSGSTTGQNQRIDGGYQRALWDPSWSKSPLKNVYR